MISGMKQTTFRIVRDDIGDKPIQAFATCVAAARSDLTVYRETFPTWVVESSERGLANWINDRMWAHLIRLVDGEDGVALIEKGVTREVVIGINYRFRLKRHDAVGMVASYDTPTFIEWCSQDDGGGVLPGMEETRLIAGYVWDRNLREIGAPVISMRDGKEEILWIEELEEPVASGGVVAPRPAQPTPPTPTIGVSDEIGQRTEESSEGDDESR